MQLQRKYTEKELDQLLANALENNPLFLAWFLTQIELAPDDYNLVFIRANHPWGKVRLILPNPKTSALEAIDREGETDVLAVFESSSGDRIGIHIENKLSSGQYTEYQPEVYAARAEAWVSKNKFGDYSNWKTVLIAPQVFIDKYPEQSAKFTFRLSHEDASRILPEFEVKP